MNTRRQLTVFAALLMVLALVVASTYIFFPLEQLTMGLSPPQQIAIPGWQLALANVGIVLVLYGPLGLAGFWFARRLGLPGIFRERAGGRDLILIPMLIGLGLGAVLVVGDRLFASLGNWTGYPHPPFPMSIVASASAGIGEETLFRLFVLGLWAFLLNLVLRRWKATWLALWIANLMAALAFGAGHLPAAMLLTGAATPAEIPPLALAELFVLNGIIGLAAGERYLRDGLVAAVGVHFWADALWHVLWPLVGAV